jgi:hypothetical protein
MKNAKIVTPKFNFLKWLHLNRIKIILSLFFIVLPVTVIFTAYIGTYTSNKKVHFDASQTAETVFVDQFTNIDQIDAFELFISWDELRQPVKNEEDVLTGGYYRFLMYYKEKTNYQVVSVNVTPLLQTDWVAIRSLGQTTSLTETSKGINVNFNETFPMRPLWFVQVEEPTLYLKIDYTFVTASNNLTKTIYIMYSLNDLNPRIVT